MEENSIGITIPHISMAIPSEIPDNSRINEACEVCPLCKSGVKLFFINFNEQILMCENDECEFPFGHEDLQFVKYDNGIDFHDEVSSVSAVTASMMSSNAWAEIDKMNKALESEDSQSEKNFDENHNTSIQVLKNIHNDIQSNKEIIKNVEVIKMMSLQIAENENPKEEYKIKNKDYIKTLMSLQQMSGCQLVTPEEASVIKKDEANSVKIDINTDSENSLSVIKVEILGKDSENKIAQNTTSDETSK